MKYYYIIDKEGNVLSQTPDLFKHATDRKMVITVPRRIEEPHEVRALAGALQARLEKERFPSHIDIYIDGRLETAHLCHE